MEDDDHEPRSEAGKTSVVESGTEDEHGVVEHGGLVRDETSVWTDTVTEALPYLKRGKKLNTAATPARLFLPADKPLCLLQGAALADNHAQCRR